MNTALFWKWFQENNKRYLNLDQIDDEEKLEALLDELLGQLHQYCSHLFFLIGGDADGPRELIITAEGDLQYFDEVEQLVADAPDIEHWTVIAFKPAQAPGFVTRVEDVEVASGKVWFMPLQNVSIGGLALRLYFPDYEDRKEETYLEAAYQMLDSLLGEKLSAEMIRYVEVAKLVADPSGEGLHAFHELPQYIEWFNSN